MNMDNVIERARELVRLSDGANEKIFRHNDNDEWVIDTWPMHDFLLFSRNHASDIAHSLIECVDKLQDAVYLLGQLNGDGYEEYDLICEFLRRIGVDDT